MKDRAILIVAASVLALGINIGAAKPEESVTNLLDKLSGLSVPFQKNEQLVYEVNWQPLFLLPTFKVGELSLSVIESEYLDQDTFTISARARSEGILASIANLKVRDTFKSIIDRYNFRSYWMLRKIRRNRRNQDIEAHFNYKDKTASIRETTLEASPAEKDPKEKITNIQGPIADILSIFYAARLREMHAGEQYMINFFNGRKLENVHMRVQKGQIVRTAIGPFHTIKISTVGGLFQGGGDFGVWYSRDTLRVPVQFQADAKVGKVYGQIIRIETPHLRRSVIHVP